MSSKAAKTPTKKTARKVRPSVTKAASVTPKRATVASLSQNLKSLETRLKTANTKNRKAIKAIEQSLLQIKATAKQGTTNQKAALTRGLNQLEYRMETYLERSSAQARAGVRSELASVTAAGADLSTLENALTAAHQRLDDIDSTQRDSLARLNRHIADLATAVDKQLREESRARKADTTALNTKIESVRKHVDLRVDRVEEETASALEVVGAKVAEFATILEQRAKTSDAETAERLADLAQETQSEFNSTQNDVTARLEALEVIASAWSPTEPQTQSMANPYLPANEDDPRFNQMNDVIYGLQDELSRMRAQIAAVQNSDSINTPAPQNTSFTAPAPQSTPAPTNVLPMTPSLGQVQDNPYAAAVQALEVSSAVETPVQAPTPPKVIQKQANSHVPQEFDPSAFVSQDAPLQPSPLGQNPQKAPKPLPELSPPPMASIGAHVPLTPTLAPAVDPTTTEPLMPAPLPVSTYADPAYAEADEMRAERIGGAVPKRAKSPKLPISGRNLRVGALAVGVAVAGLFAAKTIFGGAETDRLETVSTDMQNAAPAINDSYAETQNAALSVPNDAPPPPVAPIGQYAETQAPNFNAGELDTLDAGVAAGNPIAQFQKGLAQLQAGQMEEGARLIRLAANRNQPAAQYRLAKLYESGTGIAKDPITARELIERSARGGNRIAMHDLGNYHAYGQGGLTRDMNAALDWFTKAAERGVVDSQFNVAFLREGNEGIPADIQTALFWYHVAARQGDQGAPERINILNAELEPATQAEIKARANKFNPKPVDEAANGIFRNVSWAKPKRSAPKVQSAEILQIRDAQTLLSELGYEIGTADGIAGAKTRDAIKSFEAVNGMPQTGKITDALIEKLEIASGA